MRKIGVIATDGQEYDLDKIAQSNRDNASLPIRLQNWYWHPEASGDYEEHANPDPSNPQVGQVWISIRCHTVNEMKDFIDKQASIIYGGEVSD